MRSRAVFERVLRWSSAWGLGRAGDVAAVAESKHGHREVERREGNNLQLTLGLRRLHGRVGRGEGSIPSNTPFCARAAAGRGGIEGAETVRPGCGGAVGKGLTTDATTDGNAIHRARHNCLTDDTNGDTSPQ